MAEAHYSLTQKLQQSLSEQAKLEKVILELNAALRRQERESNVTAKEVVDLQKQVTVLLKECHDIQLQFGSVHHESASANATAFLSDLNAGSDVERVISEQLLTFKDINGLVDQNVKLRSLVRSLSDKIDVREAELKEQFEMELQKHNNEAASKISVVLERAEQQGRMIESLHSSVSMYKRLYEEEHNSRLSHALTVDVASAIQSEMRKDQTLLLDGSQESTKKPQEPSSEHLRSLEEDLIRCRSEIAALRSERDKAVLEAQFSRERLERYTEEMDHQREEANGTLARNVELSNLIIDYQKKLHERSDSLIAAEEHSRRLTTEVAVLKQEKELLSNCEKRAREEVRDLSERVHRLQASLNAIQSTEEIREEARAAERRKQEEYLKKIEREWAEAKKELQEERDNAQTLSLDRDRTIKDAMLRVEGMGKELSKVLHDLSAAEARAAVAVERYSDLERKYKQHVAKVGEQGGGYDLSSSSANEIAEDLITLKGEIERLKSELQASKGHMLQYKSIAEVNEAALKQMENANINFKAEADKLRSSLEAEILSLRDRMFELEQESSLRSKELAAVTAEKDEALALALAEIADLKDVNSVKIIEVESMEVQIRALREEVDREHKRWRVAQDNYERQVILQSETIKELTQTSQALLSLQDEASELRKCVDAYKRENDELKAKWVVETSILVEAKNEAEKKYSEINEQNKILHDRLEAMHIKLAEKDRYSAGLTSGISNTVSEIDSGLQTVMNYLRRSKEIAETEISLLKQEKLRLQSQLERAQREVEEARADRASTRTLSFTEDEFKSLQLQVRELNILRESNCQLREENKYNFNECQKLREVCEQAKLEAEHLSTVVKERETEVAVLKMEIERERSEKGNLEDKISELLERCSQVDVEDYQQMKVDLQQMQGKMKERGVEIEKMGKLISEKEEIILSLRQDLTGLRVDLAERESRISQVEAQTKVEIERQRRMTTQLKRKLDLLTKEKESLLGEKSSLLKEKESLFKEKELLLKEKATLLMDKEELGKERKKAAGDSSNEQDLNEALKEKETRIQTLERTVERLRENLKRQKVKAIVTKTENVDQEKKKIEDEQEKLKQAARKMPNELEKLKHAKDSIPEAVEDFERASHSILPELGGSVPVGASSAADTAAAAGEREKKVTMPRVPAKAARKLIRPKLGRSEEPQGDTELPEMEVGRSLPTHDEEKQVPHPAARKRPASTFASEPHEDLPPAQAQIDLDSEIHTLKKLKGSEFPKEDPEFPSSSETLEAPLDVEVPSVSASYLPQDVHEDATDTEQDGIEISKLAEEPSEVDKDDTDQADMMIDNTAPLEENIYDQREIDLMVDDGKTQSQQKQQRTVDIDDREEGELEPEYLEGGESGDMIDGKDAVQTQSDADPIPAVPSPVSVEEATPADEDLMETVPEDAVGAKNDEPGIDDSDEDPEKSNDVNYETDPAGEQSVADESPLTPAVVVVDGVLAAAVEATDLKEDASSSMTNASEEAKELSPSPAVTEATHAKEDAASSITGTEGSKEASPSTVAGSSSTTINLNERARLRSALRLGQATPTASRGRVRQPIRGRAVRGAHGRRRPTSGDQS
ncbi:Nuclear-pore anchor-like protein [Drosera capensis]